jgi:hypothetical protein
MRSKTMELDPRGSIPRGIQGRDGSLVVLITLCTIEHR